MAALVGLLGGAGALHFLRPAPFDTLIPRRLPGAARTWTRLSGAAELACAAAVAGRRTRGLGGAASALLFVAVLPGNVKMAADYRRERKPGWQQVAAFARLPLQWPLISLALRVRRSARR